MADPFTEMMSQLSGIGFFDFLLPWLFTFAVVYGLLAKADLFGKPNNKISALIGIIAAFFITPYAGPWLASYFAAMFGGAAIVLVAILTVVLFAAMLGLKIFGEGGIKSKHGIWIIVLVAVILFFFAMGGEFSGINIGSNTVMTIVFLAILVIAVWLVAGGGGGEKKEEKKPPGQPTG